MPFYSSNSSNLLLVEQMEGSFAEDLYSVGNLRLSNVQLGPSSSGNISDCDGDELWHDEGFVWDECNDGLDKSSELDREWQRRHNQFHTIGYRDGLIAGKEAAAQEGFNVGFKQSVMVGYKWGLVRGLTSALDCLSNALKEKLVEKPENIKRFNALHEYAHSLSTTESIKVFQDDIVKDRSMEQSDNIEASSRVGNSNCSLLGKYFSELQSLVIDSPALELHLATDQEKVS